LTAITGAGKAVIRAGIRADKAVMAAIGTTGAADRAAREDMLLREIGGIIPRANAGTILLVSADEQTAM